MKNGILKRVIIVMITFLIAAGTTACGDGNIDNGKAVTDKKTRTVSIVNKTDEIINEFHVIVNEGTELTEYSRTNIDDNSFSFKLDDDYEDISSFTFVFVDRYGVVYEKETLN